MLQDREKVTEEKRMAKIDELKGKKDEEVEAHIIQSTKNRVKIVRTIKKAKDNVNRKDRFKRDIILEYAVFGSKVYAPLTRDGHNPDRHPFKLLDINSDHITTYDGLSELETNISDTLLNTQVDIIDINRQYKNAQKKGEVRHLHSIDGAFESIKKHELRKVQQEKEDERRRIEESRARAEKTRTLDNKPDQRVDLDDIILLQKLLRGRKEQIQMHEGKNNRAELIKELRAADNWKKEGGSEDETKLIDNYIEKLMNGVIDAIQGDNVSTTLDFLSKEKIRIREEMKINAIVQQAENERRKREAEEMGRRQAENVLRERQDIMHRGLLQVNQATMDSYINNIISNTVNSVSKKQVMREIEIKANKLNRIVDRIEARFINDDVTVRDLVSAFIIPEINRKKVEDIGKKCF
jgi:hypothetical protein